MDIISGSSVTGGILIHAGVLLLAGCHIVFPYPSGGIDSGSAMDAALPDRDRTVSLKNDASSRDAALPDSSGGDLSPPAPCTDGNTPSRPLIWQVNMTVCYKPSGVMINQCSAATLCNSAGGWHLCTPAEYQARGGLELPDKAYLGAWIGGCVRSGDELNAPLPGICPGECPDFSDAPPVVAGWSCLDEDLGELQSEEFLGIITDQHCWRIGQNQTDNGAYWRALQTPFFIQRAACCFRP